MTSCTRIWLGNSENTFGDSPRTLQMLNEKNPCTLTLHIIISIQIYVYIFIVCTEYIYSGCVSMYIFSGCQVFMRQRFLHRVAGLKNLFAQHHLVIGIC